MANVTLNPGELVYFASEKIKEIIFKHQIDFKLLLENCSILRVFFWNCHTFVSIGLAKHSFLTQSEVFLQQSHIFCHLHTLIDRKMIKIGSFSPKNFKLAFRVPNNCGVHNSNLTAGQKFVLSCSRAKNYIFYLF